MTGIPERAESRTAGECMRGTGSCVPLVPHHESDPGRKSPGRSGGKRESPFSHAPFISLRRDAATHIVSESYVYKTETYYEILRHELEGQTVHPSSRAVLDAYVVPLCLVKARQAGIPVCDWGISQGYTPFPAVLYGLNYFATASDYYVVSDNEQAKETVRHITNRGKYPFCYQVLEDGATLHTCTAIFGRTTGSCSGIAGIAQAVYDLFGIPLVSLVLTGGKDGHRLSSLAPVKYSRLTDPERRLLADYLNHQEFL